MINPSLTQLANSLAHVRPHLTIDETRIVETELRAASSLEPAASSLWEQAQQVAQMVPERVTHDSRTALLRMHELGGQGCYASSLSSLNIVRTLFSIGLADTMRAPETELYISRGHIAPAFYAEYYVRGELPFMFLCGLHHGITGVVNRDMGFLTTLRYSLGVGITQAVSRAWRLQRTSPKTRVICFVGDSELQEGIAYEALAWAHENDLQNLSLIVDANGKGIEPLPKSLNQGWLTSIFSEASMVSADDAVALTQAVIAAVATPRSHVLTVKSNKGAHSFKSPLYPARAQPFSVQTGNILKNSSKRFDYDFEILTADMAGRFGLKDEVPYINVGLRESLSVGLLAELPREILKIVATDAKYYMDSVNILLEMTTSIERLLLLCGKSWGIWGGNISACNILSMVQNVSVYEPVTREELESILRRALSQPRDCHAASLIDAPCAPLPVDCAGNIEGGVWLTPPTATTHGEGLAVVSYGYASTLAYAVTREYGIPHFHSAALEPQIESEDLRLLDDFETIITIEYNDARLGFGSRLIQNYGLPCSIYGVTKDPATIVHEKQLEYLGFSHAQLHQHIRSNLANKNLRVSTRA